MLLPFHPFCWWCAPGLIWLNCGILSFIFVNSICRERACEVFQLCACDMCKNEWNLEYKTYTLYHVGHPWRLEDFFCVRDCYCYRVLKKLIHLQGGKSFLTVFYFACFFSLFLIILARFSSYVLSLFTFNCWCKNWHSGFCIYMHLELVHYARNISSPCYPCPPPCHDQLLIKNCHDFPGADSLTF